MAATGGLIGLFVGDMVGLTVDRMIGMTVCGDFDPVG